jgi:tetratricopeptide (TPR) repeat protein
MNKRPATIHIFSWVWIIAFITLTALTHAETLSEVELIKIIEAQSTLKIEWTSITQTEQLSRIEAIIKMYENWLKTDPENVEGLILYGKWLYSIGLDDKAFAIFKKANALSPNIAVIHQQLANYYAEHEAPQEAYEHLNKALELKPEEPIYWLQMGELLLHYKAIFMQLNRFNDFTFDLALEDAFSEAIKLNPQEPYYQKRQAEAFFYQNNPNWKEAEDAWLKLFKKAHSFEEREYTALQLAHIYYQLKNPQALYTYLNQVQSMVYSEAKYKLLETAKHLQK